MTTLAISSGTEIAERLRITGPTDALAVTTLLVQTPRLTSATRTRQIPLTQGFAAVVDAADYDDLMQFKWRVVFNGQGDGPYASRSIRLNNVRSEERMHRRLVPDAERVDHINGDTLDNRRSNLRRATNAQNMQNRTGLAANNTSGFRGVIWHKRLGKWQAKIRHGDRTVHLGTFNAPEEAARVYDAAAIEYYGEFHGYLNFPHDAIATSQLMTSPRLVGADGGLDLDDAGSWEGR